MHSSKVRMNWVSAEMMRERGAGYGTYGEMLYAESVEGHNRQKQKVRACFGVGVGADTARVGPRAMRLAAQRLVMIGRVSAQCAHGGRCPGLCSVPRTAAPAAHSMLLPPPCTPRPKVARELAERDAAELATATFAPEITRMAQKMWQRQGGPPAWERLSHGA